MRGMNTLVSRWPNHKWNSNSRLVHFVPCVGASSAGACRHGDGRRPRDRDGRRRGSRRCATAERGPLPQCARALRRQAIPPHQRRGVLGRNLQPDGPWMTLGASGRDLASDSFRRSHEEGMQAASRAGETYRGVADPLPEPALGAEFGFSSCSSARRKSAKTPAATPAASQAAHRSDLRQRDKPTARRRLVTPSLHCRTSTRSLEASFSPRGPVGHLARRA